MSNANYLRVNELETETEIVDVYVCSVVAVHKVIEYKERFSIEHAELIWCSIF